MQEIPTIKRKIETKIVFFLPNVCECIPPKHEPKIAPMTIILAKKGVDKHTKD